MGHAKASTNVEHDHVIDDRLESTRHPSYNNLMLFQDEDLPTPVPSPAPAEAKRPKKAPVTSKTGETDIRGRDKFYTTDEVARACWEFVQRKLTELKVTHVGTWLEPSAGEGAFLKLMPARNRVGIDLAPPALGDIPKDAVKAVSKVIACDFTEWEGFETLARPVVTVGNPPFGRNASMALKFINRLALKGNPGDLICFILPRTFEKKAMQAKVSRFLELVTSQDELIIEPGSFIYDGKPYAVPCCFQIWRRRDATKRPKEPREITHNDFEIVSGEFGLEGIPEDKKPHFAFQRVGGGAGTVSTEGMYKSWKSHYLIRANIDPDDLFERLDSIDWREIRARTAGNPSIGKSELVEEYAALLERRGIAPTQNRDRLL